MEDMSDSFVAIISSRRASAVGRQRQFVAIGCSRSAANSSLPSVGTRERPQLFRVVGHLPGEENGATSRRALRAGVAQASMEETAAGCTAGVQRTAMGIWALRWLCARVWALRVRTDGKVQRDTSR